MTNPVSAELKLAQMFHEAYERLAPSFGYETRAETRTFDQNSNNGKLMIAVCAEIISAAAASGAKVPEETILHLDSIVKFAYSHGFHELGYDPIATIRSCIAALTPAPVKEVPEDVRKDAELPPLPEPAYRTINGMGNPLIFFNSDDMRDYALAAIAASKGGKTG